MKKILAYTLALFSIVLMSCQKENVLVQQERTDTENNGKVTFDLNFTIPDAAPMTKAFGETVDLTAEGQGLWVIVYESGYRCEVVQATGLTKVGGSTNEYKCSLTLSVTENKRNLHFISMKGFTATDAPYEETRLGSLTSKDGVDAYWQIRTVSCIPYNQEGSASWNAFLSELGDITLIRNFAKVTMTVKTGVKFQLAKFKVFKTPDKGYVAPYISSGADNGFVQGYESLEYKGSGTVKGAIDVYPGRIPDGYTLNVYNNAVDAGTSTTAATCLPTSSTWADADGTQYFYERPVPTENPAFIIVAGKYDSDDDGSYDDENYSYYKVNLRDADDNYYALLRGFRFKVNIEQVTAKGYSTVLEAYNSAGSGDISTSLEYSSVSNISDGVCRLYVNATSFTSIKGGTIEVKYKFIPDYANNPNTFNNSEVDVDVDTNIGVEIAVNDPASGIQPSIATNTSTSKPDVTVGTADVDGWRTITVKTNEPGSLYKEQVITIRGRGKNSSTGVSTVLQRDVHIIVRPTLALYVEMAQPDGESYTSEVLKTKGSAVWINIWMEDELPESIFPLNVMIEAEKLTLTPAAGEQLPVESGQTLKPGVTGNKPAFHFVKTIKWDDYSSADTSNVATDPSKPSEKRTMRKFVCKFTTNTAESASDIYVSNELFNTATTSFTNKP